LLKPNPGSKAPDPRYIADLQLQWGPPLSSRVRFRSNVRPQGHISMHSRRFILSLTTIAFGSAAHAQRAAPREGEQFSVLKSPQPAAVPGKVEVLEFFSYACPHCFEFDPVLEKWRAQLPSGVAFRRIPVPFLNNYAHFQRAYFALEMLGQLGAAHTRLFEAVHRERKSMGTAEAIADVVASAGVDRTKFLDAFRSFGMNSLLSRAGSATSDYEIDGVPTLAVGGRYLTSPAQARGLQPALSTAEFLVQKALKG
jgi:protein dithiol oxidoreductase (disulfide-forming)